MSLLIWIILGGLAGWVASMIMGTDQSMGIPANIIVGIIGSVIGGSLFTLLTTQQFDLNTGFTGLNLASFIIAVIGSIILLAIIKFFRRA